MPTDLQIKLFESWSQTGMVDDLKKCDFKG